MKSPEPGNDFGRMGTGVSLLWELLLLQREQRALARDQARLASLEARQFFRAMIKIMVFALLGGIVALAVWFGMMALMLLTLVEHNLTSLEGGLLLLLAGNIGFMLLIFAGVHRQSRHLKFQATRKSFKRQSQDNQDWS